MKAEFYFEKISFENCDLHLSSNDIVCFVGANGVGKTAALEYLYSRTQNTQRKTRRSSVTDVELYDDIEDEFIDLILSRLPKNENGGFGVRVGRNSIQYLNPQEEPRENRRVLRNTRHLHALMASYVDARERLQLVEAVHPNISNQGHFDHPFVYIFKDPSKEEIISGFTRNLFGQDLIMNRLNPGSISVHLADRRSLPDTYKIAPCLMKALNALQDITAEGAGIQAAVGILAALFATDHTIVFIDEPDVFLHPPQAADLGEIISKAQTKQIFLATHSSRLIQGLAKEAPERLKIIRLKKEGASYSAHRILTSVFESVSADALLRFTNTLESLFHDITIICENEADCLVYSEALRRLGLVSQQTGLHFLSAHGDGGLSKIFSTCHKLASDTVVICDFDLLFPDKRHTLLRIMEARSESTAEISDDFEKLDRVMNGAKLNWENTKSGGIERLSDVADAYNLCERLISKLRACGILVVRFGELENLREPKAAKRDADALLEEIQSSDNLERARKVAKELAELLRQIQPA